MAKFGPGGPESLDVLDDDSIPGIIVYSDTDECILLNKADLMSWVDKKVFPTLGFICNKCEQGFVLDTGPAAEIAREVPDTVTAETPCPLEQYLIG